MIQRDFVEVDDVLEVSTDNAAAVSRAGEGGVEVRDRALTIRRGRVHFPGMSTVAEIERAIGHLPPEQWTEIRRWMDAHAPKAARGADMAEFDVWLAASTGIAKGKLTTDERMRETRGEA